MDINEIKKLLTYEYIVITPPTVIAVVVLIKTINDRTKKTFLINPTDNQLFPCSVDSNISNFRFLLKNVYDES